MHVQFDNLYGNAALSWVTNKILNDNAMVVFGEVRHSFGAARGRVIQELVEPFFDKHPYRTLFSDE